MRDLSSDDSYYYLQLAREFAHRGITSLDGRNATNGYHPLWLLLLTPIQLAVRDPVVALKAAKVLEFTLVLLGTMMAFRTVAFLRQAAVVAPLWLLIAMRSNALYEGLETSALYAAMAGASWALRAFLDRPESPWRRLLMGIALACTGLARLEAFVFGFVLLAFAAWELRARGKAVRHLALPTALLLVTLGVYLAVNRLLFGVYTPISGQVKQWWSLQWNHSGVIASVADLFGNGMVNEGVLLGTGIIGSYAYCVFHRRAELLRPILAFLAGMAILHITRWLWFGITTRPPFSFYTHYFVTGRWLRYGVIIVVLEVVLTGMAKWFERPRVSPWLLVSASLVACVASGTHHVAEWLRRSASGGIDWEILSKRGIAEAAPMLPKGARIASFDSGVISYFSPYPVTNLDGLVNSESFFARLRVGDVEGYLVEQGIEYIANAVPIEVSDPAQWWCARTFSRQMFGQLETVYRSAFRGRDPDLVLDFRVLRYIPPSR